MKKIALIALALAIGSTGLAYSTQIQDVSWNRASLLTLEAFDKVAVAKFVKQYGGAKLDPKPEDIGDFKWADLDGTGEYELVTVQDVSRRFFNALIIYRRDQTGKITSQEITGWMISDLNEVVRDLLGNGKDELVVPTQFGKYGAARISIAWPAVYEMKDGEYVEASRDFPGFYDDEVLPGLEKQIQKSEQNPDLVANLTLARDKILRAIGRNPNAGVQEAYQWMNSNNPHLLQAAALTFQDIGGHEKEVRELQQALPAAKKRAMESRGGG
jgi:hypothetical protein